jgi:hypothetical protein
MFQYRQKKILYDSYFGLTTTYYSIFMFVQFLWNSFISKEAVAAEQRYEKETSTCMQVASNGRDKRGWLALFPAPPPSTHALPMLNLGDFQHPRPKARMASI